MSSDRIAVDANVLVYALYQDTPQHATSAHRHTLCYNNAEVVLHEIGDAGCLWEVNL